MPAFEELQNNMRERSGRALTEAGELERQRVEREAAQQAAEARDWEPIAAVCRHIAEELRGREVPTDCTLVEERSTRETFLRGRRTVTTEIARGWRVFRDEARGERESTWGVSYFHRANDLLLTPSGELIHFSATSERPIDFDRVVVAPAEVKVLQRRVDAAQFMASQRLMAWQLEEYIVAFAMSQQISLAGF